MKYVSLDIETTGLDPYNDQVLQLAMVLEDTENQVDVYELPKFVTYVQHEYYTGSAFALWLNRDILGILAEQEKSLWPVKWIEEVEQEASKWLWQIRDKIEEETGQRSRLTVAGKNVANFDLPFLPKKISNHFKHRVLDVGSMCVDFRENMIPGLQDLLERYEVGDGVVKHDAYEDALDVIRIVRQVRNQHGVTPNSPANN